MPVVLLCRDSLSVWTVKKRPFEAAGWSGIHQRTICHRLRACGGREEVLGCAEITRANIIRRSVTD